MDDASLLHEIEHIIQEVFANPGAAVTRETVASDIDGWDSLSHAILVLRIESAFGIEFPTDEVYSFSNVGELADRTAQLMTTQKTS